VERIFALAGSAVEPPAVTERSWRFGIPSLLFPYTSDGERISGSSTSLGARRPQRAKALLGRSYTLTGSVVKGQQLR